MQKWMDEICWKVVMQHLLWQKGILLLSFWLPCSLYEVLIALFILKLQFSDLAFPLFKQFGNNKTTSDCCAVTALYDVSLAKNTTSNLLNVMTIPKQIPRCSRLLVKRQFYIYSIHSSRDPSLHLFGHFYSRIT